MTNDPKTTYRLLIGGAHYWGSWRNGQEAARRLAHVTGQRITVKLEPPEDQAELMIDLSPFIDAETWARAIKRPWWRRAGTVIATWWLDLWHSIPYLSPEAMLVILLGAAAFALILAILTQTGAKP